MGLLGVGLPVAPCHRNSHLCAKSHVLITTFGRDHRASIALQESAAATRLGAPSSMPALTPCKQFQDKWMCDDKAAKCDGIYISECPHTRTHGDPHAVDVELTTVFNSIHCDP